MTLSLIVAEVVTNSLKHAFRLKTAGSIRVEFIAKNDCYVLTIADDGSGLPADFEKPRANSLGQAILKSLASQLHGKLTFEGGAGTTVQFVFPA